MNDQNPDYDQLWKEVITELFEEFLLFFSPELFELVDFTIPPQFLEQELQTILPESESNQRVADKLVKLQLKNGSEQWVYVHVEVQGYYKRFFQSGCFSRSIELWTFMTRKSMRLHFSPVKTLSITPINSTMHSSVQN